MTLINNISSFILGRKQTPPILLMGNKAVSAHFSIQFPVTSWIFQWFQMLLDDIFLPNRQGRTGGQKKDLPPPEENEKQMRIFFIRLSNVAGFLISKCHGANLEFKKAPKVNDSRTFAGDEHFQFWEKKKGRSAFGSRPLHGETGG